MALPSIKINYLNGLLGTVPTSNDGLMAFVTNGTAVAGNFVLGTPYTIQRYSSLDALGITAVNNPAIEKFVKEFYAEAPEGTNLMIVAYAAAKTMTDLCDKDSGEIRNLLTSQQGSLRGVIVGRDPSAGYTPVTTDGLDADVFTALPKAQALADWCASELFAPIFMVLEGRSYTSTSTLKSLATDTNNRVMILIGDTASASNRAAIGTLSGRIASIPVQRSIARVKDNAVHQSNMYIGNRLVENSNDLAASIHDKGYVTLHTFMGKSGYFFTDDKMACKETDDYAHLANRRVIDKAYRIAYTTMVDQLNDEVYINEDGTMQPAIIKNWQTLVEDAIASQMTAFGELSADVTKGETGCKCFIDSSQNVLSTSMVEISLQVRPFGYARYIVINLGFQVTKS